jgi:hypothetical protein
MRSIDKIIVHESDSIHGSTTAIRAWHLERGFLDVGYHFVILNGIINKGFFIKSLNGQIEVGRPLEIKGAGVKGHNIGAIHICLIGKDGKFTEAQIRSLLSLIADLKNKFSVSLKNILGHYELNRDKVCPEIDMNTLRKVIGGIDELN